MNIVTWVLLSRTSPASFDVLVSAYMQTNAASTPQDRMQLRRRAFYGHIAERCHTSQVRAWLIAKNSCDVRQLGRAPLFPKRQGFRLVSTYHSALGDNRPCI